MNEICRGGDKAEEIPLEVETRPSGPTKMSHIFLSYSRRDAPFVGALRQALEALGHDVWVDHEDIRPTEEWLKSILSAIEGSNAVVFIVSPSSAASTVCGLEINHAVKHQKRLLPVLREEVLGGRIDDRLAALQFVFLRQEDDFTAGVAKLDEAIRTDLPWADEHARLLKLALDWDRNGRRADGLLRGKELVRAEAWLAKADQTRRPAPIHRPFLEASRRHARRLKSALAIVAAVIVATALSSAFLYSASRSAEKRAIDSGLAELTSGSPSPLDAVRRTRLEQLLEQAASFGYRATEVGAVLARYPAARPRELIPKDPRRRGVVVSPGGDRLFLLYSNRIESYGLRTGRVTGTYELPHGELIWAAPDPAGSRVVFEAAYADMAEPEDTGRTADEDESIRSSGTKIGREQAFFTTDCGPRGVIRLGLSVRYRQDESWDSRGDSTTIAVAEPVPGLSRITALRNVHRGLFVEKPLFENENLPPIQETTVRPLCVGNGGNSSLSLVTHLGPTKLTYPVLSHGGAQQQCFFGMVEDTDGKLGNFARHIADDGPDFSDTCQWQLTTAPVEFEPTAINMSRGLVLLRDRLFRISGASASCTPFQIKKDPSSQGWQGVRHIWFTPDGQGVVIEYEDRDVDYWDVSTVKRTRRFLLPRPQIGDVPIVAIDERAETIYLLDEDGAVTRWGFREFGADGWATSVADEAEHVENEAAVALSPESPSASAPPGMNGA